jgi:hypothetical protein
VPKRDIVRVVLSPEQKEIPNNNCRKLGESETLHIAFLVHVKESAADNLV